MLSKNKRVTKEMFQDLMAKGNIVSGSFFVLRYQKQDHPQYSFVAPKKIAKTAVLRNSLRRKGYNLLRSYDPKINVGIFFYKKEAISVPLSDLKKDLDFLLKKAKII